MSECWNMTTNYALIATTLRNHPLYIQVPTKWKISDSIVFTYFFSEFFLNYVFFISLWDFIDYLADEDN